MTSHGKITKASHVNDYLTRGIEQEVSGVALFTWSTLGPFLDEVHRSGYIRAFAERIEATK